MTAGSGIIHQEMPAGNAAGEMHGFQLWANLSRDQKMCTPRYQDIKSENINSLTDDDGTHIRVIAGDYRGYRGPVDGIDTDPCYLDITLMPNTANGFLLIRADRVLPIFLKDLPILAMRPILSV